MYSAHKPFVNAICRLLIEFSPLRFGTQASRVILSAYDVFHQISVRIELKESHVSPANRLIEYRIITGELRALQISQINDVAPDANTYINAPLENCEM